MAAAADAAADAAAEDAAAASADAGGGGREAGWARAAPRVGLSSAGSMHIKLLANAVVRECTEGNGPLGEPDGLPTTTLHRPRTSELANSRPHSRGGGGSRPHTPAARGGGAAAAGALRRAWRPETR